MSRATLLRWMRPLLGAAVVLALLWRVGAAPFLAGVSRIDVLSVLVALVATAIATTACAWRWALVARALGVDVSLSRAIPAYYRSQFLNSTLPGGVVGDVERAVRHGHGSATMRRAATSVFWERVAGQGIQLVITLTVVLCAPAVFGLRLPGFWRPEVVVGLVVGAVAGALALAVTRTRSWRLPMGVLLTSLVAAGCHLTVFLVAIRITGVTVPASSAIAAALVVLGAAAIPLNVAGWGPREGAAAWAFATMGLGTDAGVAVAAAYGVLAFLATLPGAFVIVAQRFSRPRALALHGAGDG